MSGSFLRPLLRNTQSTHTLRNTRNGRELAHDLIAAFDSKTRRTGLLRHETFRDGSAMLIAPSNAVHTFFMRFPIDIAFVTRDGRIVKTYAALKPWRMAAAFSAYAVVELPPGTLARNETVAGDVLSIEISAGAVGGEGPQAPQPR
jgi:uncharacterized membrane protein (UPF0127 family)